MKRKCKLCLKLSDLQNSHAIPDSVFKKIFRTSSGKAIDISPSKSLVSKTQDSLATDQLCVSCEKHLNNTYEDYSLKLLRNYYNNVEKKKEGILFTKTDVDKFKKFILSVFWRALHSEHLGYSNASLPKSFIRSNGQEIIRHCIYEDSKFPEKYIDIKVQRLTDRARVWSDINLKEFIMSPYCRQYKNLGLHSVVFIFEGFKFTPRQ